MSCAGLTSLPSGDWLCDGCLDVLDARKKSYLSEGTRSAEAQLPPLPELDSAALSFADSAQKRFREEMTSRKQLALGRLEENQAVLASSSQERVATLTNDLQDATVTQSRENQNHNSAKNRVFARHMLTGWSINSYGRSHINFRREDGSVGTVRKQRTYSHGRGYTSSQCPDWNR